MEAFAIVLFIARSIASLVCWFYVLRGLVGVLTLMDKNAESQGEAVMMQNWIAFGVVGFIVWLIMWSV
jgi:hypothetical protein